MKKDIKYYMDLDYPVEIRKDPSGGYFVRIPDLENCMSQGETTEEALSNIDEARRLWIEVMLEDGHPIPEPQDTEEYSGKILVRMPKLLHKKLAVQATRENISLNQYMVSLLSEATGIKHKTIETHELMDKVARLTTKLNSLFSEGWLKDLPQATRKPAYGLTGDTSDTVLWPPVKRQVSGSIYDSKSPQLEERVGV